MLVENMQLGPKIFIIVLCSFPFVASFSWKSCGQLTQPIKILSLDEYTDHLIAYITIKAKVGINITAPVEARVEMQKKFFWGWTTVPCIKQVGSCTYTNICSLSPYQDELCPDEYVKNNLPCKCPILKGQYAAKKFPIDLSFLPNFVEKGAFRIKTILTKNTEEIFCLLVNIVL